MTGKGEATDPAAARSCPVMPLPEARAFCFAVSACVALGALGGAAAFCAYTGGTDSYAPAALPGLFSMLMLVLVPGVLAGDETRLRIFIAGSLAATLWGAIAARSETHVPLWQDIIACAHVFALLAVVYIARKYTAVFPPCFSHFRRMSVCAIFLAVLFMSLGCYILTASDLSARMDITGKGIVILALYASLAGGMGPLSPRLYPLLVYFSLLTIWLVVPVTGLEAYVYYGVEDIPVPPFALIGWKWVFALCVPGLIVAARLLQLGYKFIATAPPFFSPEKDEVPQGK